MCVVVEVLLLFSDSFFWARSLGGLSQKFVNNEANQNSHVSIGKSRDIRDFSVERTTKVDKQQKSALKRIKNVETFFQSKAKK